MRAKKFVCCLLAMMLLAGVSFISCGNSSKAKADSELTTQDGEDFKSFLDKFTSSAAFQYTRIKFIPDWKESLRYPCCRATSTQEEWMEKNRKSPQCNPDLPSLHIPVDKKQQFPAGVPGPPKNVYSE